MKTWRRTRILPNFRLRREKRMLSVFYGDMPEAIYDPVVYFKNTYTDEWITDELSREMIRDVDRSIVIGPRVIDRPVLGGISPRELSGGESRL